MNQTRAAAERAGGAESEREKSKDRRLAGSKLEWSKRMTPLDILSIVGHLQFTLNQTPAEPLYSHPAAVSLKTINRQATKMIFERLPEVHSFNEDDMAQRVREILSDLVAEGRLGYALLDPGPPNRD
jgi:hypothetical protein